MSGGSMDYLYQKIEDATFLANSAQRKAFRKLLDNVAAALRAIEWNDSGDGCDNESELIEACLHPGDTLSAAIESYVQAAGEIKQIMEQLK